MNGSNYSEGCSRSTVDQLSPIQMTAKGSEGVSGNNASIYRELLRNHQNLLFMEETKSEGIGKDDTCEWTSDVCSRSQTSSDRSNISRRSSGSSRGKSPPSLYPRVVDGSFHTDHGRLDNSYLGFKYGRQYDVLQRRHSDNIDQVEPVAALSSSISFDLADSASGLSRASSFYQEALKEATGMEDKLMLQNKKKEAPQSTSASPFYIVALEDAAPEEEEELLILKHHKQNLVVPHAVNNARAGATAEASHGTIYKQSSFYRTALEEAFTSLRGKIEEPEEDPIPNSDECDLDGLTQQGRSAIVVDLPNNLAANSDGTKRDNVGDRQSTICSFSSSVGSSYADSLATNSMISPPVLSRATPIGPNLFEVQRRLSDVSFSPSSVLQIKTEGITPSRRSRSFVDDSCAFSVTRSSALPHMTSPVLFATPNEAGARVPTIDKGISRGKDTFHDCAKPVSVEREDDQDLRMAIYLSRVESSAASSLNSEGSFSVSLSTNGSRGVPEEESKSDQFTDDSRTSYNPTENSNGFLMSQVKAMEDYQRSHSKIGIPNNTSPNVTTCSSASASATSDENHFSSSRDTSTSSSSTTTTSSSHLSSGGRRQTRRRSLLETRGASETRQAISNGNSHVVKCKGCSGRLQTPVHYSLVFCPKCKTVSPA